jgi:DNA-binding transcriptional MerR regulator
LNTHTTIEIPNKSQFKSDEVCGLTGVKPYVLRFWESEFDEISPITSSTGQKLFQHKDIEAIALIKKFLFDDKLTIEEARRNMGLMFFSSEEEELPSLPSEEITSDSVQVSRGLNDSEIQKLVLAKAKLNSLMSLTDSLKERHNW